MQQSMQRTDYIVVTEPIKYLNYIHCQYIHLYVININTLELVNVVKSIQFIVLPLLPNPWSMTLKTTFIEKVFS